MPKTNGIQKGKYGTILIDPPWRFINRTGKMAPEHKRLHRYPTMAINEILALPVGEMAAPTSYIYLWVPNALLRWGLDCLEEWGFEYKTNLIWYKQRKDGGPDGRGVGFYFRNVTEVVLFGVRGTGARTREAGRRQTNIIASQKEQHSKKPDELYSIIEACSHGPYLELFARFQRRGWDQWGNEMDHKSFLAMQGLAGQVGDGGRSGVPGAPRRNASRVVNGSGGNGRIVAMG